MPEAGVIRNAAREIVSDMLKGERVSDEQPLISSGMIDSLSILTLISKLERTLAIRIATDSLQPEDFENVELIVETVQRATQ